MADTPETNPKAPALSTLEGKLTVVAVVLGVVLEGVATVIHQLQDAGVAFPWFPAVLALIGAVGPIVALFGLQKNRSLLKATMIRSNGGQKENPP